MTKKKKATSIASISNFINKAPSATKPWCWYCDREFEDLKVLIIHQKTRHFRCGHCQRKMNSASGLVVHLAQLHKVHQETIPNCIPGHDTPELEIYGMDGIPEVDLERHRKGLPPVPYKRQKLLAESPGSILPLLAAQKASAGAISITGRSTFEASLPAPVISPLIHQQASPALLPPSQPVLPQQPTPSLPVYPSTSVASLSKPVPPIMTEQKGTQIAQIDSSDGNSDSMPRYIPPRIDPATGKLILGQLLMVLHPETSLEEQRAASSRYQKQNQLLHRHRF